MNQNLAVAAPMDSAPLHFEAIENDSITRILKATREHLGTEIAFVGRYVDGNQRELMHVDTDLDLPMGAGFREPLEESFCWHILEGRLPSLIHDAADYPLARMLPVTNMLPVGCHLNVPLRLSDGSVFGSFCCVSRQADRTVTDRDIDVLQAFAKLAAEQIESTLVDDQKRTTIEQSIDQVIADCGMSIVMQPIHDLADGSAAGFECLARFPDAGTRGPDAWFGDARQIGRGVALELVAIDLALEAAATISKHAYVSINASPETILSGELTHRLKPFADRKIVVELTEHARVENFGALANALHELSDYATIAIDDVGAGYAGLRYLVDLAPDLLKLDMSLTRNIDQDIARQALASAIVHFAKAIGSEVVAEGIETDEERDMLRQIGVRYGQGYHYSRPMPFVAAAKYMLEHGTAI